MRQRNQQARLLGRADTRDTRRGENVALGRVALRDRDRALA